MKIKLTSGQHIDLDEVEYIGNLAGDADWQAYSVHFKSGRMISIFTDLDSNNMLRHPYNDFVEQWMLDETMMDCKIELDEFDFNQDIVDKLGW